MNTSQCGTCGATSGVLLVHWLRICGRLVVWTICRTCQALEDKRDAELQAEREAKLAMPKRRAS